MNLNGHIYKDYSLYTSLKITISIICDRHLVTVARMPNDQEKEIQSLQIRRRSSAPLAPFQLVDLSPNPVVFFPPEMRSKLANVNSRHLETLFSASQKFVD
jgi:hypothetical protein